jgi:CAAX protease family protein
VGCPAGARGGRDLLLFRALLDAHGWVYDRAQSELIAILMHLPLIVFLFVLLGSAMAGVPELIFNLVFGATLWVFVAAVAAANRRKPSRRELCHATHTRCVST